LILYIAGAVAAAAGMASYIGSMRWLKIKHERFRTDKNINFRILQISDFHANSLKRTNERMWEKIHALDFDLVAITGDLIQWRLGEIEPIKPHLLRLVGRAPVLYVDGNHEKYIYEDVYRELDKLGVTGLYNRRVTLEINGAELDVVGVGDYYKLRREGFVGVREAFGSRRAGRFTLVLSHQPTIIDKIGGYAPDLLLCGHTHGGQVRFPFLPAMISPEKGFFPRFDHGWYKENGVDMFISKGIGATHFNVRFYNRAEVAVIEVCNEQG